MSLYRTLSSSLSRRFSTEKRLSVRFASAGLSPMSILLVDDSLSILKVTSRTLKMKGHTVETAENGIDGLEKLKKAYGTGKFNMVLTDLQMPIMDGIEATRRYREFEAEQEQQKDTVTDGFAAEDSNRLIIIGMSANSDAGTAADALAAGMSGFIGKPFNYEAFEKAVLSVTTKEEN
jgi:CheY-like chemotaxis protein